MNILVMGGRGFIGARLTEKLGNHVTTLGRNECLPYNYTPSVIFYCAGVQNYRGSIPILRDLYHKAYVELPKRLTCTFPNANHIYISTTCVDYPENRYAHNQLYVQNKLRGEAIVRKATQHSVVRPGLVYGPGDMHHLPLFRSLALLGRWFPLFGSGMNEFSPVYVDDVVRVLESCIYVPQDPIYVSGQTVTMEGFVKMMAEALSVPIPRHHWPPVVKKGFFTGNFPFRTDAQTTPHEEGLRLTVAWYREQGLL